MEDIIRVFFFSSTDGAAAQIYNCIKSSAQ